MGLFSRNMNETKGAGGSRGMDLACGAYTLTLREAKGVQTRSKGPALDFIFEVTTADGEGATKTGSTVNEYCMESNDIGAMYMKTLLVCLAGLDENNADDKPYVKAEDWDKVRDRAVEGLFNGRKIDCVVRTTKYKNKRDDGKAHYDRRNYAPNAEVRAKTLKALAGGK
jgi:hypothetical protein